MPCKKRQSKNGESMRVLGGRPHLKQPLLHVGLPEEGTLAEGVRTAECSTLRGAGDHEHKPFLVHGEGPLSVRRVRALMLLCCLAADHVLRRRDEVEEEIFELFHHGSRVFIVPTRYPRLGFFNEVAMAQNGRQIMLASTKIHNEGQQSTKNPGRVPQHPAA